MKEEARERIARDGELLRRMFEGEAARLRLLAALKSAFAEDKYEEGQK